MEEALITFDGTSHAVRAEQLLLAAGLRATVMPLPGAIRAGCGIALRLSPAELPAALAALERARAARGALYRRLIENGHSCYKPIEEDAH